MLDAIAKFVTRRPKLIVMLAVLLLIPSVIGYAATRVNYDILTYIPQDMDSARGEKVLEEPFKMAATAMMIVQDMPADYVAQLQDEIEEIDGVSSVLSIAGSVGSQIPQSMMPQKITDFFYADNGDTSSTMMMIFFDSPAADKATMNAIGAIRDIANEKCFLSGFSVLITDTQNLMGEQMPIYVGVAVLLAVLAMTAMMSSWILPLAIIVNIGLAIAFNMGSNVVMGEISFVTSALAAILQLGVTMDYSVFLYNRYREELPNFEDHRDAMAAAIKGAFISLSGSSLTTVAGFAALCFMQLTLGRDVGIVMMKGVLIGILCVVLILPSIILLLDGPIKKYQHKAFDPNFEPMNRFIVKHRIIFVVLAVLMIYPAWYSQTHTDVYHDLIGNMVPADASSMVASHMLEDDYNIVNQHFLLIHHEKLTTMEINDMVDELENIEGVDTVMTFRSWVPSSVPDFFIPDDVMDMFQQEGWSFVMINSMYDTGSALMEQQIVEIQNILERYDPEGYMTGSAVMAQDLFDTADEDFAMTTWVSILAILVIVAVIFRSISMPVILVACIELAIFINEGVPYWQGSEIPFIANTFIGCIQLGATVDYSILLGTRFREEIQAGYDRKTAMIRAATSSDHSIITGGIVLFMVCLSVSLISTLALVSALCTMLARGTVISMIICLFFVPPILLVTEPLIRRTSLNWAAPAAPKAAGEKPRLFGRKAVQAAVPATEPDSHPAAPADPDKEA